MEPQDLTRGRKIIESITPVLHQETETPGWVPKLGPQSKPVESRGLFFKARCVFLCACACTCMCVMGGLVRESSLGTEEGACDPPCQTPARTHQPFPFGPQPLRTPTWRSPHMCRGDCARPRPTSLRGPQGARGGGPHTCSGCCRRAGALGPASDRGQPGGPPSSLNNGLCARRDSWPGGAGSGC